MNEQRDDDDDDCYSVFLVTLVPASYVCAFECLLLVEAIKKSEMRTKKTWE